MTRSMELQPTSSRAADEPDAPQPKPDISLVESAEGNGTASYADTVAARISKPHRDFLMQRHGTLDLDPVPSMDPADPYNWPTWKVSDWRTALPYSKTDRSRN